MSKDKLKPTSLSDILPPKLRELALVKPDSGQLVGWQSFIDATTDYVSRNSDFPIDLGAEITRGYGGSIFYNSDASMQAFVAAVKEQVVLPPYELLLPETQSNLMVAAKGEYIDMGEPFDPKLEIDNIGLQPVVLQAEENFGFLPKYPYSDKAYQTPYLNSVHARLVHQALTERALTIAASTIDQYQSHTDLQAFASIFLQTEETQRLHDWAVPRFEELRKKVRTSQNETVVTPYFSYGQENMRLIYGDDFIDTLIRQAGIEAEKTQSIAGFVHCSAVLI